MTMIKRDRQLFAVADDIDAGRLLQQVAEVGDQVLQHADDEAAGHGPARTGDAADQRAGEAVEQDARHHVGLQIDGGRHQRAGHRADRRGQPPAQRQHPVDADAGEARRGRILRGSAHRKPQRREAEEGEQRQQQHERHQDHADLMRADVAGTHESDLGEGRGKRLDGVTPNGARHGMEDRQQADEHDHHGQDRRVVQRSQDHALDADADQEREQRHGRQRDPEAHAPFEHLPAQEGAEHG